MSSKKLTSTESSNDESEDSDSFQQEFNTKRAKLAIMSDTTLQDLPNELLEHILVKAVAMEVKDLKVAKSVWEEKADLVAVRLGTVCSHWSRTLATNFFRNELHRTLDGIAQEIIRMEVLHEQHLVDCSVLDVTSMEDDVFLLCSYEFQVNEISQCACEIRVYNRNDMAEVPVVIAMPGIRPIDIAACNVSNCLYVHGRNEESHEDSILRITREEDNQFKIHTWISDLRCVIFYMNVSTKGTLIVHSIRLPCKAVVEKVISIYSPYGFLQREVIWSPDYSSRVRSVFERSNGNLVFHAVSNEYAIVLTEMDSDGVIRRKFESSLRGNGGVNFVDASGRILIYEPNNGIELLDSELNLLDFTAQQPQVNGSTSSRLHYNSKRNEVIGISRGGNTSFLTIFRLSEE